MWQKLLEAKGSFSLTQRLEWSSLDPVNDPMNIRALRNYNVMMLCVAKDFFASNLSLIYCLLVVFLYV